MSAAPLDPSQRDRPSKHGKLLGEALALIADKGRACSAESLPDTCLTCAFRRGCMTNQMASTGKLAFDILVGLDKDDFACHHGMKDGSPTKLCAGYLAAKLAPWKFTVEVTQGLAAALNAMSNDETDEVREQFDAWLRDTDPDFKMDAYQLARAYASNPPKAGAS